MNQYLSDVSHAVTLLLDGIYFEGERLDELERRLQLELRTLGELGQMHRSALADPFEDDEGIATASYWEAYDRSAEVERLTTEADEIRQAIVDRQESAAALSGALLQIARQGIALVHGDRLADCPDAGRRVGSQSIRDVIWQARNQAMHYEVGNLHQPVIACFAALEQDFGSQFSLARVQRTNLAFEVVKQLAWRTFADFASDLDPLLINKSHVDRDPTVAGHGKVRKELLSG